MLSLSLSPFVWSAILIFTLKQLVLEGKMARSSKQLVLESISTFLSKKNCSHLKEKITKKD